MDRLHVHVGELVGDIEIGVANDLHLVHADQFRIAGGQVEFLVDDAFAGLGEHGQPAERDLAVAAVVMAHDAFIIFHITGHDRHFRSKIDVLERVEDRFVQGQDLGGHPAGKIDEPGIDPVGFQDHRGIESTVRFADRRQEFPRCRQIIRRFGMARGAQITDILQAGLDPVQPLVHKSIRLFHIQTDRFEGLVVFKHFGTHVLEGVLPFLTVMENMPVNAGGAGLFVFQQRIGDAGISRHHKCPVVEFRSLAGADDDIFHDLAETAHRGPADFFDGMFAHDQISSILISLTVSRTSGSALIWLIAALICFSSV